MTDEIVIKAEGLTKKFGNFTATDHVTFEVRKGEIFGFLGANGAGKTTAMRMLCGLSQPSEGKASVAGYDVATEYEQVKRHIGYMSQKFSLYDDLTVEENLVLFGGIYGMPRKKVRDKITELLQELGFETERKTMVKSLPLGWKQKLAFSLAIFHEPSIVFLDEPTGGVDPVTRRQFWELIYRAADNGITDLATFVDYCKAHPGEVKMGGSSAGSVWHIAGGYLMNAADIDLKMITYADGAAGAVKAAAQQEIQGVTVSLAEARSFIESGDLICLGVMDEERNPVFPDVPTCKEQGYDITYYTQRGMAAPLGVDDAIMTRLEEACAAAIEDPDFVTFMNNNGQAISYLDAQGYADYLKQAAVDVAAAMDAVGL